MDLFHICKYKNMELVEFLDIWLIGCCCKRNVMDCLIICENKIDDKKSLLKLENVTNSS